MTSFIDSITNLWSDAFLAGMGDDFDDDDDSNNNHKDDDIDDCEQGQLQRHQRNKNITVTV